MDFKRSKKLLIGIAVTYWLFAVIIYLVAGDQFHYVQIDTDAPSASSNFGELIDGMEVTQRVTVPADQLTAVELMIGTYWRENVGTMQIWLTNNNGETIACQSVDISAFVADQYNTVILDTPVEGHAGDTLNLMLTTTGCMPGNAITVYSGNTIAAGRFDVAQSISDDDLCTVNGQPGTGKLCIRLKGMEYITFYKTYWVIVLAAFSIALVLCIRWWKQGKKGKNNPLVSICTLCTRYGFLIKQLVSRDFKTKYKRSVLGMFWSFLNPLLTMLVQYIVFSTLFKSDIDNFPVYLISGTIFFSFFTEAVGMGMTSITGNASLIKKVYMPKYIYPVSRVLSSLINFVLAIMPLFIVMLATGATFSPALLLLIFDVICLLGFVIGMSLLMTTAMTFFQDTQFLWNVVSMMWMYLTPIFYPESIIPVEFLTAYHMNPMYQYITFARICILDGISPEPMAYLWCILSSAVVLLLGIWVFKKHQDQFIMQL